MGCLQDGGRPGAAGGHPPLDPRLSCPAPNVVFVLGGPGAGKGTMCELAEGQLGWVHLSTGSLLRSELEAGGPSAAEIENYVNEGKLVPNGIVVKLLKEELFKSRDKCVEIDCNFDRQTVYDLVREQLLEHTDEIFLDRPLTERSEILLGLRPWPKSA